MKWKMPFTDNFVDRRQAEQRIAELENENLRLVEIAANSSCAETQALRLIERMRMLMRGWVKPYQNLVTQSEAWIKEFDALWDAMQPEEDGA